jgi:RNA polymerase sigma-70 factor (ECF subfamily)
LEGCVSDSRTEETDEALMLRFQRGDRAAFTLLVRRHQMPLYNFALRHLGGQAAAEDVVQETFVRVAQNAADFQQAARLTTWLYTIARNLCVDSLRKMALRRHASLDEPARDSDGAGPTLGERVADARSNVERTMLSTQIGEQVVRAVLDLPDDQREVFLLREVSSLPFKEIAEIVGAQENTVKSRMRYALLRLQSALSDLEEYARALR